MTGIANHAKKSEREKFGDAVKGVSDSICGLIEAAAQVMTSYFHELVA